MKESFLSLLVYNSQRPLRLDDVDEPQISFLSKPLNLSEWKISLFSGKKKTCLQNFLCFIFTSHLILISHLWSRCSTNFLHKKPSYNSCNTSSNLHLATSRAYASICSTCLVAPNCGNSAGVHTCKSGDYWRRSLGKRGDNAIKWRGSRDISHRFVSIKTFPILLLSHGSIKWNMPAWLQVLMLSSALNSSDCWTVVPLVGYHTQCLSLLTICLKSEITEIFEKALSSH